LNSKDLENKSPDELVEMRAEQADYSQIAILVNKEFERRAREHQHEIDRKLIMEQVKWMKFSVYAIISTTIGYGLTKIGNNSLSKKIESLEKTIQIHISEKKEDHYKEITE
jgi:hypothetical protein